MTEHTKQALKKAKEIFVAKSTAIIKRLSDDHPDDQFLIIHVPQELKNIEGLKLPAMIYGDELPLHEVIRLVEKLLIVTAQREQLSIAEKQLMKEITQILRQ